MPAKGKRVLKKNYVPPASIKDEFTKKPNAKIVGDRLRNLNAYIKKLDSPSSDPRLKQEFEKRVNELMGLYPGLALLQAQYAIRHGTFPQYTTYIKELVPYEKGKKEGTVKEVVVEKPVKKGRRPLPVPPRRGVKIEEVEDIKEMEDIYPEAENPFADVIHGVEEDIEVGEEIAYNEQMRLDYEAKIFDQIEIIQQQADRIREMDREIERLIEQLEVNQHNQTVFATLIVKYDEVVNERNALYVNWVNNIDIVSNETKELEKLIGHIPEHVSHRLEDERRFLAQIIEEWGRTELKLPEVAKLRLQVMQKVHEQIMGGSKQIRELRERELQMLHREDVKAGRTNLPFHIYKNPANIQHMALNSLSDYTKNNDKESLNRSRMMFTVLNKPVMKKRKFKEFHGTPQFNSPIITKPYLY